MCGEKESRTDDDGFDSEGKKTRVEMARIPHETFCALFAQFTNHFNTERNGEVAAL